MNAAVAPELTVKSREHWGSFLHDAHYTLVRAATNFVPGGRKSKLKTGRMQKSSMTMLIVF